MSAISELTRQAIFESLNVSGVTSLATGGVHFKVAPPETAFPFVVFDRIPGSVDYAFAKNLVGERDLWMVKALTDSDSSADYEPPELAENILTACETAINGTLNVSGKTNSIARRRGDIPPQITDQSDRQIWQHGFYLDTYSG